MMLYLLAKKLFPYTTLFRSPYGQFVKSAPVCVRAALTHVLLTPVFGVAVTENVPSDWQSVTTVTLPTEPGTVTLAAAPVELSHSRTYAGTKLAAPALNSASRAFWRALFKLTSTMDAKMPMIAITIKSSINVKPFVFFILCHLLSFLYYHIPYYMLLN